MLRTTHAAFALSLSLPLAFAIAPAPAATSVTSAAAAAQIDQGEWIKRFKDAMRIGDRQTMERLFKSEQTHAISWIITTTQRMGSEPSEALAKELEAQKKTWKAAYDTRFVDKMERYYAFLRPQVKTKINGMAVDASEVAIAARGLLADKGAERRMPRLKAYVDEAKQLALQFEELGDRYYAGEMWLVVADCSAPNWIPEKDADLGLALEGYRKFVEHRGEIELVNNDNRRAELAIEALEAKGAEVGAGPGPSAGIELGRAASTPGRLELEDEVTSLRRPTYLADAAYLTWNTLWLPGPEGEIVFPGIEGGPRVKRTGAASIRVTGSDGEATEISLSNRIQLVETTVGSGDERHPWAFLVIDPGSQEFFNTVPMNMAAGPEGLALHVGPAASQVYELGGTEVRVFDDNLDGVFGGPPATYVWPGMAKGEFDSQLDSMLVGRSKQAVPFSKFAQVDDQWYQLEPEFQGNTLRYTPADLKTGTLKLDSKGVDFAWYVVAGEADLEGAMFDLAGAKRGVEVPVGRYRLISAGLREGKRSDVKKALVTPPLGGEGGVSVTPDGETEVAAGAPYGFDFDFVLDGNELEVDGESVVVVGAGGERYHRIWNARNEPSVELRKAGSGRGSSVGSLQAVWNTQEIIDVGTGRAWKPLNARVPNRYGDEVEVRLVEKKNPLFGKIESDWIAPEE